MIPPAESDPKAFAKALLAGTHNPSAIAAEFLDGTDAAVDITGFSLDQLEAVRGSRVLLPSAIATYLASGDELSNTTLDNVEIALEQHYGICAPWFITSSRKGKEKAGTLQPISFYLDREE